MPGRCDGGRGEVKPACGSRSSGREPAGVGGGRAWGRGPERARGGWRRSRGAEKPLRTRRTAAVLEVEQSGDGEGPEHGGDGGPDERGSGPSGHGGEPRAGALAGKHRGRARGHAATGRSRGASAPGEPRRGEEDEERRLEAAPEEMGETSPLRKADILRTLPDDDDEADVPLERGELHVAGGSTRSKVSPRRRSPAEVLTRGRSALISREVASARMLPGAASSPSAAPSPAPGALAAAPRASRLSGFKLGKRTVSYAAIE